MRLTQIIEALLFASDAPLSAADLSRVDERLDEDTVEAVIRELRAEYELGERSFQVYEVAGGYQLLTRPEFVAVLERYDSVPQPARLSVPALEVLAIIAYRQPIGRAEVEDIRGVGSSGVLRTLVERDLVAPVGRAEGLGRPLLYGTTKKFMEHFGFRSLEDLPRPDELPIVLRERGVTQQDPDATPTDATPSDATPSGSTASDSTASDSTASDSTASDGPAVSSAGDDGAGDAVDRAADRHADEPAAQSEGDGSGPGSTQEPTGVEDATVAEERISEDADVVLPESSVDAGDPVEAGDPVDTGDPAEDAALRGR